MPRKYSETKDTELLPKIAEKDLSAFDEIYTRFSQVVYNLSYKVLNNKNDAEEVVQEVFLQIWNKASNYDKVRGAVSTWIINITRSRAIDKFRSLKNVRNTSFLDNDILDLIAPKIFIIEDASERKNIIKNALEQIPADQKDVIDKVYFEGATHIEAADILKIPVGTVKTRLRLGILKLRESISPYIKSNNK